MGRYINYVELNLVLGILISVLLVAREMQFLLSLEIISWLSVSNIGPSRRHKCGEHSWERLHDSRGPGLDSLTFYEHLHRRVRTVTGYQISSPPSPEWDSGRRPPGWGRGTPPGPAPAPRSPPPSSEPPACLICHVISCVASCSHWILSQLTVATSSVPGPAVALSEARTSPVMFVVAESWSLSRV